MQPGDTLQCRLLAFEALRYFFYACNIIFGIVAWATTVDDVLPSFYVPLVPGTVVSATCNLFARRADGSDMHVLQRADWTCALVIAAGVVLTVVMLLLIAWHSVHHFGKRGLEYGTEMALLFVMALVWLVLAVVTLAKPSAQIRSASTDVRVVIAACWVTMFTHFAGVLLAFVQWREERLVDDSGSDSLREDAVAV